MQEVLWNFAYNYGFEKSNDRGIGTKENAYFCFLLNYLIAFQPKIVIISDWTL